MDALIIIPDKNYVVINEINNEKLKFKIITDTQKDYINKKIANFSYEKI